MSKLFSPLRLRSVEFPHRVFVSPMCQYSSEDGLPNEWHLVHLGSRAIGGASLVLTEASAVTPEGRITPWDAGIWSERHAKEWKRVTDFIRAHGSVPGMQIAHAGRKASCNKPWLGGKPLPPSDGGWTTLGPSAIPFGDYPVPRAMSVGEIEKTVEDFRRSARFALDAGFDVAEVHAAHGYLIHEFLSPLSNQRTDAYGGSLENRMRFGLAAAIMAGIFYDFQYSQDFGSSAVYDEYQGGDLHRQGYLGQPLGAGRQISSGVWRRDFQNGVVFAKE